MADEIETQLSAMVEKAPLVPEVGDEGFVENAPAGETTVETATEENAAPAGDEDISVIRARLAEIEKRAADKDGQAASERARRRQAEAQARAASEQLAAIQQRIMQAQQRARMGNAPDPEENVVEALKYERQLRLAREQQDAQRMQQMQATQQQANYINELKTTVEDYEAEFRAQNPDYDEAAEWLVDMEQRRLEMTGVPKEQAEQYAINWAVNMTSLMLQQGKNPAQVAYEAAKMMNWQPKGGKAQSQVEAAVAAAAAGQQKLAQQKAGQSAAKTMSGGGIAQSSSDSLSHGNTLKGAAFDKWAEKFLSGN